MKMTDDSTRSTYTWHSTTRGGNDLAGDSDVKTSYNQRRNNRRRHRVRFFVVLTLKSKSYPHIICFTLHAREDDRDRYPFTSYNHRLQQFVSTPLVLMEPPTMSKFLSFVLFLLFSSDVVAFSLSMSESAPSGAVGASNRRSFLSTSIATVVGGTSVLMQPQISRAATAKEIITTKSGIKYAITKEATDKKPTAPYKGESKSALRS